MHKLKPLGNRVLVQRSKAPTTKGGIILPEAAQEKPKEGSVIDVGPGKRNEEGILEPMIVKKGDRVLFSSYSGTEVGEEKEFIILTEDDILGVLT